MGVQDSQYHAGVDISGFLEVLLQYRGMMSEQIAKVVEGPHLLYVGANGHKTFGITVETVGVVQPGYSKTWTINDCSIKAPAYKAKLGLSDEEYRVILAEIDRLVANQ